MKSSNVLYAIILSLVASVGDTQMLAANQTDESLERKYLLEIVEKSQGDDVSTKSLINETSTGGNIKDISPKCDPKVFENNILEKQVTDAQFFKMLNEYFTNCVGELKARNSNGIMALLKFATFKYSFLKHPQVSEFTIKLDNGVKVPAIIALKPDNKPRPLIVVKCGTFCAAEEGPSMKAYMMSLFDQSPFNVVFLASQTGVDYIKANQYLAIGGWAEGLEAIEVGTWLKEKWEYKDRISSIHLMGLSLGGNAAVFGSAYNDLYEKENGGKVFSSVTAICPVIDLKPTLDHLFRSAIVGPIFSKLTRDQFLAVRDDLKDITDLLGDNQIPRNHREMADYLTYVASTSLGRRGTDTNIHSYTANNNFWNLNYKLKTPTLVWASKDDIVVNNYINAQSVDRRNYGRETPHVGVLNMEYGSHCAFHSVYGALAASTVLRTFVLSHSPEFKDSYVKIVMPWKYEFNKMGRRSLHLGQTFEFSPDSAKVTVKFRVFNGSSLLCTFQNPWKSSQGCIDTKSFEIPIDDLKSFGARIPQNSVEAEALTREFNTKIDFKTHDMKSLNGTSATEFLITGHSGY